MLVYLSRAVLGSANDAALLAGLGCGDFLVSLSCTQKSVSKCSLWLPTGMPVASLHSWAHRFDGVRLVLLHVSVQALL